MDLENSILRIHRFLGQCIYQHKLLLVIFFQRTFVVPGNQKNEKKGGWGQETETIHRFSCTKLNKSMLIKANRNFLKEE